MGEDLLKMGDCPQCGFDMVLCQCGQITDKTKTPQKQTGVDQKIWDHVLSMTEAERDKALDMCINELLRRTVEEMNRSSFFARVYHKFKGFWIERG